MQIDKIFTPHPIISSPTEEQIKAILEHSEQEAAQKLLEIETARRTAIYNMDKHPLEYGWIPDCWKEAEKILDDNLVEVIFGGTGSSKTHYAVWRVVKHLLSREDANVLCLHESEQVSIMTHQTFVNKYLPAEFQTTDDYRPPQNASTRIAWNKASGFYKNKFSIKGSVCTFGFYNQDIKIYEGPGFTMIYADEDLPLKWFKTLVYRMFRVHGKFLWTFTPINGITQAIKHVTDGAKTIKSRRAKLLPKNHRTAEDCPLGNAPVLQESKINTDWKILYFFSEDNLMGNYEGMRKELVKSDLTTIERRAYGFTRDTAGRAFPSFNNAHICSSDEIPKKITRYFVCDPAERRNMFSLWFGVDPNGDYWFYREWPDYDNYGEWALPSEDNKRFDGTPGPAQRDDGFGVIEYKRLILELEGNTFDGKSGWSLVGEEIEQRFMDPRAVEANVRQESGEGISLADVFEDEQERDGIVVGPSMSFTPANNLRVEERRALVNSALEYRRDEPISVINPIRLHISSNCKNLIWCMFNHTGKDGQKGASKDPIDCLEYGIVSNPEYIDPHQIMGISASGWR